MKTEEEAMTQSEGKFKVGQVVLIKENAFMGTVEEVEGKESYFYKVDINGKINTYSEEELSPLPPKPPARDSNIANVGKMPADNLKLESKLLNIVNTLLVGVGYTPLPGNGMHYKNFEKHINTLIKRREEAVSRAYTEAQKTDNVTRVEVIDETGRAYVKYGKKVELSLQDDGRTLKVFVTNGTPQQ